MQGRAAEARAAYQKAVDADALFVLPLVHLAGLALAASRNGEALEFSARALRPNPLNLPRAWFYHCVASFDAGHVDAAEKSARRTIEEDKEHGFPRAEYLLGVVLARRGESGRGRRAPSVIPPVGAGRRGCRARPPVGGRNGKALTGC